MPLLDNRLMLCCLLAAAMLARPAWAAPANDASADFPVRVGPPYTIGQTAYTPTDTMNYDAVGHATIEPGGETRVAGAHHTLPVPSYVEVTALDSGKTILVRIDQRGPMDSDALVALSAGAAAQLGVVEGAAVRVRRVNPPEAERALLRAGNRAPERMETPPTLLAVLKRRLQPAGAVSLTGASQPLAKPAVTSGGMPPQRVAATATPADEPPPTSPEPPATAKPSATRGEFVVQLGAFTDRSRAEALAGKAAAYVSAAGQLWRVRKGPFASRAAAAAALAKLHAEGLTGAIERAN